MRQVFVYRLAMVALWILNAQDANVPQVDAYGTPRLDEPWQNDAHVTELGMLYAALAEEAVAGSRHSKRFWVTRASIVDPRNSVWSKIYFAGRDGAFVLVSF